MIDFEDTLDLTEPKIVMTKFGERAVRSADPTEEFWEAWRENKATLKAAGWSVSKSDYTGGKWQVTHWGQTMSREKRAATADASRAQDANIDIPIPEGLALLPYQKAGVAYALDRVGTLIGDEMGLGKTVQAIAIANVTKAKRILVICPSSLRLNWQREIGRWQTLNLPTTVVIAGDELDTTADGWYVINYDIIDRYDAQTKTKLWDIIIIDECHYLKNPQAQRTRNILGYKNSKKNINIPAIPAAKKVLLTGTPILNRPVELFTLINYLDPLRWNSWYSYAKRYCNAHSNGFGLEVKGAANLDELQARLRETVMVRRLKKDVLTELPAKVRQVVVLEPSSDVARDAIRREVDLYDSRQKDIQEAAYEAQRAEVEGDEQAYKDAVKRLRQAQGVLFTEVAKVRHEVAQAKIPDVIEHLKSCGTKTVVFAHHKDVVAAIVNAVQDEGVVSVTGDTALQDRQDAVDRFQSDPGCKFFVGNIKAAGVGLTLTASSHVVFAELDWTPGNVTQAEDRCHRIGQRDSVFIEHIVLDGSLDARIAKMLVEKQRIIDLALDAVTNVDVAGADPEDLPEAPESEEQQRAKVRRQNLDTIARTLTQDQIQAIHQALRTIASMDVDGARLRNDVGFNGTDTRFGRELAARDRLSPRQAAVAMRMIRKYRRQYEASLYERIFGNE